MWVRVSVNNVAVVHRGAREYLTYNEIHLYITRTRNKSRERLLPTLYVLGTAAAWRRYSCSGPQTALKSRFDTAKTTLVLLPQHAFSGAFSTNTGAH